MREISSEEATTSHCVTTLHHQMPNGELRFRLKKSDGSAYIRTEASDSGAWQKSHFHNNVRETYIVQRGWIAYAAKIEQKRRIEIYRDGELFTTQPGIIHNVYMSSNSAIHTVKHGVSLSEDRITNSETKEFDRVVECLADENAILSLDDRKGAAMDLAKIEETYNVAYRHYDDLIWRAPLWVTGIFTATMVGLNSATQEFIARTTGIVQPYAAVSYLMLMFVVTLAYSFAFHRFRVHQRRVRTQERRATPPWKSASTIFNVLISVEAFALLCLALIMAGWSISWAMAVSLIAALTLAASYEFMLRR